MSTLLLGAGMGAAPLAAGVLLGIYVARSFRWCGGGGALSTEQAEQLIQQLRRWTDSMVDDVDECQRRIVAIGRDALQAEKRSDSPGIFVELMSQMVEANRNMQQKLAGAETALAQQAQRIAGYLNEARTDSLTGLPNRRMFDEEFARRHADWKRYGTPLSLLLFDIDHFKQCNDAHGHVVGDNVLKRVAHAVGATLRESDLLARYGGEEFAALLGSTNLEDAKMTAQRARQAVEDLLLDDGEGHVFRVTMSCGLASPIAGEDPPALLKRADDALYASKSAGRNCGHWHDGERVLTLAPNATAAPGNDFSRAPSISEVQLHEVCVSLRQRLLEITTAGP